MFNSFHRYKFVDSDGITSTLVIEGADFPGLYTPRMIDTCGVMSKVNGIDPLLVSWILHMLGWRQIQLLAY